MNKFFFFFFFEFHCGIWFNEHTFRKSHLQMVFEIGALKNFAIFQIKKRLQNRYFPVRPVNIAKFLKEQHF